jgi:MFS family permease
MAYPNLRLFLAGQAVSNIGSFSQTVALSLLVLQLTDSGFAIGATMSVQSLPMLLLTPVSGPLLDRLPLRRVLLITALLGATQAALLSALAFSGQVSLPWVLLLAFLLGTVMSVDRPAGQTFLSELVPRPRLAGAVSLATSSQAVGRLIGPAVAALLYAWQGPGPVFAANAVSYLAVVVALLLLRTAELHPRPRSARHGSFGEAIQVARRHPVLRVALLVNAFVGLLAFNFPTFFSTMSSLVFGQPALFGIAEATAAGCSIVTGVTLARKVRGSSPRITGLAAIAFGASLGWIALSPTPPVFLVGMLIFGVAQTSYLALMSALVQQYAPREMTGRFMTLHFIGNFGTTPLGGLLVGWVIDQISPRAAVGLGAVSAALGGLALLLLVRTLPANEPASDSPEGAPRARAH